MFETVGAHEGYAVVGSCVGDTVGDVVGLVVGASVSKQILNPTPNDVASEPQL